MSEREPLPCMKCGGTEPHDLDRFALKPGQRSIHEPRSEVDLVAARMGLRLERICAACYEKQQEQAS